MRLTSSAGVLERKTARLTLLIDPDRKTTFERLCASQDLTPFQVTRRLIREYRAAHQVEFAPAGPTQRTAPRRTKRGAQSGTRSGSGR